MFNYQTFDKIIDLSLLAFNQDDYGLAGFKKATDLKYKHPHLKVPQSTSLMSCIALSALQCQ